MAFYPYLNFKGNCREAFTRYHEIFGGDLNVLSMADMPPSEGAPDVPADQADLVMHAALMFDDHLLMASDTGDPSFDGMRGMYVNYNVDSVERANTVFAALAEGGDVEMDIGETFWSPAFGVCVDRFGTPWMVSADPSDA